MSQPFFKTNIINSKKKKMKYYYLIVYLVQGREASIDRFFKASRKPLSFVELRDLFEADLKQNGMSLEEVEIINWYDVPEADYYKYKNFFKPAKMARIRSL